MTITLKNKETIKMHPITNSNNKREHSDNQIYIDLNCDLGQGFGVYKLDKENGLLPYVSSVNISCGAHSGDPLTIMNALKQAKENNVAIGAHIGFPDIQGFGYRQMNLSDEELQAVVLYQIGAVSSMASAYNLSVDYVRPHGALYRQAATDINVATSIAKAIQQFDQWLIYVGASGEVLNKVSADLNIRIAGEAHIDKSYNFDGTIDFDAPDNLNEEYALGQLKLLIKESCVINLKQGKSRIKFSTIHLNMKSSSSVKIAQRAKELIKQPTPVSLNLVSNTGWL